MEIDAEILAHYAEGREHARLTSAPSLELLRTEVLLERFLPAPPARVLDVGGASGVYASWLSGRGYQVHLIDPVPLHWAPGIQDRLNDPAQRQLILDTLAAMEHDPAIAGATAHLLAIGQNP